MVIRDSLKFPSILVVLSLVFFMLGNGVLSLTDPDEVFYAQTAKEMAQHNTWLVPYLFDQPQLEKPILFYWLLRVGFILFGVSSFAARFFPALFAAIGVLMVYFLGLYGYKETRKAFICALILLSGVFYVGLARTVFTDMVFSVFILLSLASFFAGYVRAEKKAIGIILFFVFSGLAVLTKGPLGLVIPLLTILLFLCLKRDLRFLCSRYLVWGSLVFLLISLPWYIFMFNGFRVFLREDFMKRLFVAEHPGNDRWYFYPLSMIFCMFPFSVYAAVSPFRLFRRIRENKSRPVYIFLACWIIVTLAVFQFMHSKLVSYILPLFPALALIAGDIACDSRRKLAYAAVSWFLSLLLLIVVVAALVRYPEYVFSVELVYGFIFLDVILLLLLLFFILKRNFLANIYASLIQVPLFLLFVFLSYGSIDAYFSSKAPSEYLLNNYAVKNTIICSRPFVRGVRYYTGNKVAGVNAFFFSPHPIPCFNSDKEIGGFLRTQGVTYGVLKKASLADVGRAAANNGFKVEELKRIGDKYIVRVSPVLPEK